MNEFSNWHGKPYYSLDAYCKNVFGHKCYKIALDAHMTCPNRDGSLGTGGCIFCSAGGSGDFAVSAGGTSVTSQLQRGLALFGSKKVGCHFIAYFQAYTNTYAPLSYLEEIYTQSLEHPDICGISIATRPDCLPQPVIELLKTLQLRYPGKFIWIELGLQTMHETTAAFIRRGYPLSCFEDACRRLHAANLPFIVHIILGLPHETKEDMLATIDYLNPINPFGIKLQLLHVLKNTALADYYAEASFEALTKEAYLDILIDCLEHLSPEIVVHRVTGDGPRDLLLAPLWSCNKRDVLNTLHRQMKTLGAYQGRLFSTKP